MKKVCIVMSTYNGEKYLVEQVKSILLQKNVDIDIYIRDDGSNDNTCSILKTILEQHDNIHVIFGNNLGYARSFMETLKNISQKYDYYAFSDQDDYWEDSKIYEAINLIETSSNRLQPSLYYSNLKICDEKLNYISTTRLEKRKQTFESNFLRNSVAGCTMVFNYSLYNFITCKNYTETLLTKGHDFFILLLCYAIGGNVICDPNSYIKRRKHDNNTSGTTNNFVDRIKREKKWFFKNSEKPQFAAALLNNYFDNIDEQLKKSLTIIKDSKKFQNRLLIIFSSKYTTGNLLLTLMIKLKALFGLL